MRTSLAAAGYDLSARGCTHVALPYGGRQDARLEAKYIQCGFGAWSDDSVFWFACCWKKWTSVLSVSYQLNPSQRDGLGGYVHNTRG
jgi:hypothetical protein